MRILSLLGIIIALGIGFFIWQNQIQQVEQIGNSSAPSGILDNIKIPKNTLDFSSQGLTKFPSEIFDHPEVQVLDLSNNKLRGAIPAEIRELNNLEVLNLSNNQMTGLPAELGQLSRLKTLDVSNNYLTGLPYELGNLKNLQTLKLSGNNYSKQDLEIIKKGLPASVNIIL